MHSALLLVLLSHPGLSALSIASPAATQRGVPGEVTELIVPKAYVQKIECKGEWHLKNKMWSCPSLTVAFNCYRPKVEPRFSGPESH
jgi:hypothetical protein